jgi:hypothetical protein
MYVDKCMCMCVRMSQFFIGTVCGYRQYDENKFISNFLIIA